MSLKSVILFGASGLTGLPTLQQTLDKGYKVTAVVRNPDSVGIKHENLTVAIGNALDRTTFTEAMKGKDAVISCLGPKFQFFGTMDFYSKTMEEIHAAMVENGVKRGIFMSSWGTGSVPNASLKFKAIKYVLGVLLDDLKRMEDFLETTGNDIDYTVVRPPQLLDGPKTEAQFVVEEGANVINDIVAKINRADVGRFLLTCLETEEYNKKMLAIGVKMQ